MRAETLREYGLAVPVGTDLIGSQVALERIRLRPFVEDANDPRFAEAQRWIADAGAEVRLPLNFCGGLLIMRLYRLVAPPLEQTGEWMSAVHDATAAYDFAFLALGHADDEADHTLIRDGMPTRFVSHPETRAVDGINLLLSGVTAMQEILNRWPRLPKIGAEPTYGRHPLAFQILEALVRALREASFPIVLDRSGLGHESAGAPMPSGLSPILVDGHSLHRLEAFSRHRAHSYFMRAIDLATLLAGYDAIEPDLLSALDDLFGLLGLLGAATDDIQDIYADFAVGIHSTCTVMAHLCVAANPALRPMFRRDLSPDLIRDQADRLAGFFGVTDQNFDRSGLLAILDEIQLRRALTEHFEGVGARFAASIYKAASEFEFSAKLVIEMVSVVSRDPGFEVPEIFLSALESPKEEGVAAFMNVQVGKFVAQYLVDRFWPRTRDAV